MNTISRFKSILVVLVASSVFYFASSTPSVSSSAGPKSAALLDLQSRIVAMKKSANEAVKNSGLGEAIKLGGYLNTLSGLELGSITSYPVAELSFYLANLGLFQNIVNVVSQVFYVAGNSVSLSSGLITLQINRQACPTCPLLGDPRVNVANPLPANRSETNNESGDIYMSSLDSLMNNLDPQQIDALVSAGQTSQYDLATIFVLNGGINNLLSLSTDLMAANAKAFQNISP